jgi:glycosidase
MLLLLSMLLSLLPLPGRAAPATPQGLQQEAPEGGDATTRLFLPAVQAGVAPPTSLIAPAANTPNPTRVTIAGSLQSELGCPGDWQPECAATGLAFDVGDDVWQGVFALPTGAYEYKAALNGSWTENYGANAQPGGANIPLALSSDASVKFYYDHKSNWITDNRTSTIATVPGSFQSELGCAGDWQPDCLRSWLQDPDGDGIYTFSTDQIPVGSYEGKVALNESWDVNYGEGGAPGGPNLAFTVPAAGAVTFSFDAASKLLTISFRASAPSPDNNIEYSGLGHNSHDTLYRTPFGAVNPGDAVTLRFRTYANDVTRVRVRVWNATANAQSFLDMTRAAVNVSCYDAAQPDKLCDYWQATLTPEAPTTLYYRFIVQDGTATAYYDDDDFRNGGWGEARASLRDNGYAITVFDPDFQPIPWMQNAVVYQIFPDRFRDGRANNNPRGNEPRYSYPTNPLDQIVVKTWSELPEGFCRAYQFPAQPCTEQPRGRDYFGGDLRGILQRLPYLKALGVNVLYLNPVFDAGSNHAYDTQDYYKIDPFFGSNKEFQQLAQQAERRGIRIVLDGVFNHVSSDSAYFDRYSHFSEVGACESVDSPYRTWFFFRAQTGGPCAGPNGPNTMTYDAWFGFDSLPVLDKNNPAVRSLIYADPHAVARYWLTMGAAGWRLDVMGDPSFPADFWPAFRDAVKATKVDAPIIGELWKKFEVLPQVLGNSADTTMNYRFRNAILGFFGRVDDKGFPDDGQSDQPPSLFAEKLISVREDYPDAAYYTLLNLLGSHDTQRILWALTPGNRNREDREFNAANLAAGKQRLMLAAAVQMTTPGAPTIYYGDEVALTGDDDPDDRRTFPWRDASTQHADPLNNEATVEAATVEAEIDLDAADVIDDVEVSGLDAAGKGGIPGGAGGDATIWRHYAALTTLRQQHDVFRNGALSFLLTDDANRTLAYLMRTPEEAAVVAINRNSTPQTLAIPLNGKLADNTCLYDALNRVPRKEPTSYTAVDGVLTITLPPLSVAILLPWADQDIVAPPAPTALTANAGDRQITLAWNAAADAASYRIYRSPVTGGGYVLVGSSSGASYTDANLTNAQAYYYVVKAVDAVGNVGAASNEASGAPSYQIGWANLQWPPTMEHTISTLNRTPTVYGQVWIDGVTGQPGATPTLQAQLGFGPAGSNPATDAGWRWVDAAFNTDAGNNDEFMASLLPDVIGSFDYVYRYSTNGGRAWLYADINGPVAAGGPPPNPGKLTVNASGDVSAPTVPANLRTVNGSPAGIELAWDAASDDGTVYGYEVRRSATTGGPYATLALVTSATTYTDVSVEENGVYFYVVRAVDASFNRSGDSNEATGTAALRTVTVTFNVTTPGATPAGATVYIAGALNRLDGGLPEWNPGGVSLTPIGPNSYTITVTGKEGVQIEYKYTLGVWENVEKGVACEEIGNRQLTLAYGSNGQQTVNDSVANWRNVAPCGN